MNPLREAMRVALRAAIATNAEARACTRRLAGKSIAFEWSDQRLVIRFDDGAANVGGGADEASATVRGSPVAVLGALLGGERGAAAVLGDAEAFEDFRASFRPHLPKVPRHLAEDIGDAAHLAARAAQSALEGLLGALREHTQSGAAEAEPEGADDVAALRARIGELEARLAALEPGSQSGDNAAADAAAATAAAAAAAAGEETTPAPP